MNRILIVIAALVLLAVGAVLGAPGIIGPMAEDQIEAAVEQIAKPFQPYGEITTESYERGWFDASARHRLSLDVPADASGAPVPINADFVFQTRVTHGPFMKTGSGISTALATTVSTIAIEADGETINVPGNITTTTDLSGAGEARYVAEELKTTVEEADLEWDGADVQLTWDSGFTQMDIGGRLEQLRIASPSEGVEIVAGPVEMDFEQHRTEYGFWAGGGEYRVSELSVVGPEQFAARDLGISGSVELSGDKASYVFGMDAASVEVGDWSDGSFAFNVQLGNLDAATMAEIYKVIEAAQPGTNWMALMPELSNFMGALLAGGPELHVKELRVDTPMGEVLMTLNLSLPEDQVDNPGNLPGLMMALVGDVSLKFPQALVSMMAATDPQVEAGVQQAMAMGFILEQGSDYIMDAEYQGGLLTVNGNPFPLGNLGM